MDNIFEKLDPVITNHVDDTRDYLEELVGEGKKFKSVKDLAKGKAHADAAVEVLKRKVDELQSELNGKMNMDNFITEMKKLRSEPTPPPVIPPDTSDPINALDLDAKFEEYIQKREAKVRTESNLEKVQRVIVQNFGPEAQLVINKKAQELGMSLADLQGLAARSPTAFFNLVGASENATRNAPSVPGSGINTSAQSPARGLRGKKFYDNLRQTDPKTYNHRDTVVQMMKDAAAWGSIEAFNSN